MPAWGVDELPAPPAFRLDPRRVIGPGLMMAGAAIGGGEWLTGPAMTAKYGGALMWVATLSILFQAAYNFETMRYTLYSGETIFVGFFRTPPGPQFWTWAYLFLDFGAIWPYLAANAAVPIVSVYLGMPPGDSERDVRLVQLTAYAVFLAAVVPLAFGGKIYNVLERIMVLKIVLVLGYLLFLGFFYVHAETWREIFLGFVQFGRLPQVAGEPVTWAQVFSFGSGANKPPIDLALLGAFAAIAGQGGLTNLAFSAYAREKGWGMGKQVGAIPSFFGGHGIALSHFGKVFRLTSDALACWRGWLGVIFRDQMIWVIGCILGMGIPALVSLEFVRGQAVTQNNVAALTAETLAQRTGVAAFWYLTLLCGFFVLWPSQVSSLDGFVRRWTDVIWTGSRQVQHLHGDKVVWVYYSLVLLYAGWGLFVLTVSPRPLTLVKVTGILMNYGLGLSSLHMLATNCTLLPKPLRPGWLQCAALVGCGVFFIGIAAIGTPQAWHDLSQAVREIRELF